MFPCFRVDELENSRGRSLGSDCKHRQLLYVPFVPMCSISLILTPITHTHCFHCSPTSRAIHLNLPLSSSKPPQSNSDRYLAGMETTQALGTPPRRGVAWHLTEADPSRCQLLSMIFKILRLVQIVAPPPSIIPLLP